MSMFRLAFHFTSLLCVHAADVKVNFLQRPDDCSEFVKKGDHVEVRYKGSVVSTGFKFDDNYDEKQAFIFRLGTGEVLAGWDQGLLQPPMCLHEKRGLTVPPELAYGGKDKKGKYGKIPGNEELYFEIEMINILFEYSEHKAAFDSMDTDNNGWLDVSEISVSVSGGRTPEELMQNKAKMKQVLGKVKKIMSAEDRNGDGKIFWEEFSGNPVNIRAKMEESKQEERTDL